MKNTGILSRCNGCFLFLLTLVISTLLCPNGVAQEVWDGSTNSNWTTASNWQGNIVPGPSNDVLIPSGVPNFPILNTAADIKSVEIASNAQLEIGNNGTLNVSNTTVTGITVKGQLKNNGTININNTSTGMRIEGVVLMYGDLNIGTSQNISNDGIYLTGGELTLTTDPLTQNDLTPTININNVGRVGIVCESCILNINETGSEDSRLNIATTGTPPLEGISVAGDFNLSSGQLRVGSVDGDALRVYAFNGNVGDVSIGNEGALTIGSASQSIGEDGIEIDAGAHFETSGTITIRNTGNRGILSRGTFTQQSGGTLHIDQAGSQGIYPVSGSTFTNGGDIYLGGSESIDVAGIFNGSNFTNQAGGNILIDRTGTYGINQSVAGSFTNHGNIEIGSSAQCTGTGIRNVGPFTNASSGTISIDRQTEDGLLIGGSTSSNAGSIAIGQQKLIGGQYGVELESGILRNDGTLTAYDGDFIIQNGATAQGNGAYYLQRNFSNSGTFSPGTSKVHFNGSTVSTVSGNALSFFELSINKTVPGEVYFDSAIEILNNGSIEMVSGVCFPFSPIELLANSTIENESESSYFIGSEIGVIRKTIDLNAPNNENPGNIGVQITSTQNLGSTTIERISKDYFINEKYGVFRTYNISPTHNKGLNATVRFQYRDGELGANEESKLAPYRFNGTYWEEYPVSSRDETANWVETKNVDAFSLWTLAESQGVLPVELTDFTVSQLDDGIQLRWQTATETNNEGFEVQHSTDGRHWDALGFVEGHGTTFEKQDYTFTHRQPSKSLNYYRLKQQDFDGQFEYSPIRSVLFNAPDSDIKLFPNPANAEVVLQLPTDFTEARIQLFDASGRALFAQQVSAGQNSSDINLHSWPNGLYLMKVQVDGRGFTRKLQIQKK